MLVATSHNKSPMRAFQICQFSQEWTYADCLQHWQNQTTLYDQNAWPTRKDCTYMTGLWSNPQYGSATVVTRICGRRFECNSNWRIAPAMHCLPSCNFDGTMVIRQRHKHADRRICVTDHCTWQINQNGCTPPSLSNVCGAKHVIQTCRQSNCCQPSMECSHGSTVFLLFSSRKARAFHTRYT